MLLPSLFDLLLNRLLLSLLDAGTHNKVSRWSCNEERRTCTDNDAKQHGEGEGTNAITTEDEDDEQHDERRY